MLLALAGCASPGAPQPPSLHLPRPVSDLQAQRVGDHVQLRWTMPGDTTDGLALAGQKKVTVCRRIGAGVCAQVQSFPEMPKAAVAIKDALPGAMVKAAPELLTYEVQVMNEAGRSAGSSNPAYAASGAAPAPVSGLNASVTEKGVLLQWQQAVDTGAEILLRRERQHADAATPAAAQPVKKSANPFAPAAEPDVQMLRVHSDAGGTLDVSVAFGESYAYTAQRVKKLTLAGQSIEVRSEADTPITVAVRDTFPPQAPQGLAASLPVKEPTGNFEVDLSWEPNAEADLAGYFVYRKNEGRDWQRVNLLPLSAPAIMDTGLRPGVTYSYAVSAVDKSGNESKRSAEIVVVIPQ
jgi:hypothetical protein